MERSGEHGVSQSDEKTIDQGWLRPHSSTNMASFDDPAAVEAIADLKRAFPTTARIKTRFPIVASAGPMPHFVEVLLDALTWKAFLGVPATAFLTQLAKNAADDVWKNKEKIRKILRDAAFSTLADVSFAIAAANEKIGSGGISLALPCQDHFWSARTSVQLSTPEEISIVLTRFVASAEKIQTLVERERATYPLYSEVRIEIDAGGKILVWWNTNHKKGTVWFFALGDDDFEAEN